MTKSLPVVFCVYREAAGPVFASQVVNPVAWLLDQGCDVRLLCFVPVGTWFRGPARRNLRRLQHYVREQIGDRMAWLPAAPSRMRSDPLAQVELAAWLRGHYGGDPVVLHCRGRRMTEMGLRLRRYRSNLDIVYDCRGIDHAEFRYEQKSSGKSDSTVDAESERRYAMQKLCVNEADGVLCVSHAMARYVESEYERKLELTRVVPCVVDVEGFSHAVQERENVRAELGLEGKFVVIYNGSMHTWQMPVECLRIFRLIREFEPEAHFLALTTNPAMMRAYAATSGIEDGDITVRRVAYDRVPRYLAAADVGLLLRERSTVNEVASPVKFGEYLASGLPVIMTEGIGDYSDWARKEGLGLVLDLEQADRKLLSILAEARERFLHGRDSCRKRCRATARTKLSPDNCYPALLDVYAGCRLRQPAEHIS